MMQLLFLFSMIFQATSSVHVLVADGAGNPMPGVQVSLVLYDFETKLGQTEAREVFSDQCRTDSNGECTIRIGETSGVLRGRLELGKYGGRDVIWTGGVLDAPVLVDLKQKRVKGMEAGPYDFQEKGDGILIRKETSWLAILIVTTVLGGIVFWAYLQSRKEHA
jgi:hypothetical protein